MFPKQLNLSLTLSPWLLHNRQHVCVVCKVKLSSNYRKHTIVSWCCISESVLPHCCWCAVKMPSTDQWTYITNTLFTKMQNLKGTRNVSGQVPPDKPDQDSSIACWLCRFATLRHTDGCNHDILIKNITDFRFNHYAGSRAKQLMPVSC